ncbi:MAG: hypothetical protein N3G80_00940 [Candidatus Micrarchaeota archaeon]|nr:hypothetical protein [Candidatus Micrarchaeota archaeon]
MIKLLAIFVMLAFFGCAQQETPAKQSTVSSGIEPSKAALQTESLNKTQPDAQKMQPPASSEEEKTISAKELSSHSSLEDCWVAYQGTVYDITSFIPTHPNWKNVFSSLCGTSEKFEAAFVGQHGFSKVDVLLSKAKKVGKLKG